MYYGSPGKNPQAPIQYSFDFSVCREMQGVKQRHYKDNEAGHTNETLINHVDMRFAKEAVNQGWECRAEDQEGNPSVVKAKHLIVHFLVHRVK